MDTVDSNDGTTIGFDRLGSGPPVVLVCGGSVDRMSNAGLAGALAYDATIMADYSVPNERAADIRCPRS